MSLVDADHGISQKDLAAAMMVNTGTLSGIIKLMDACEEIVVIKVGSGRKIYPHVLHKKRTALLRKSWRIKKWT